MTEPTHDTLNWDEPARTWLLGRLWGLTLLGDDHAAQALLRDALADAWVMGAESCVAALNAQTDLVPPGFVQESQRPAGYAGRPDFLGVDVSESDNAE